MTGFELLISGVESDRSTNCATTTAHYYFLKYGSNLASFYYSCFSRDKYSTILTINEKSIDAVVGI